jgi:hypothetical protein
MIEEKDIAAVEPTVHTFISESIDNGFLWLYKQVRW